MEAIAHGEAISPKIRTLPLDEPIVRGENTITELQVRKPKPGDCRGLKLSDLGNGDVSALSKLLPRITTPALTEQEIADGIFSLQDLTEAAEIVVDFLFTKARKAGLSTN